jgi:Gpi18-like mannosyltransferase
LGLFKIKIPVYVNNFAKVAAVLCILLTIIISTVNLPQNQLIANGFDRKFVDIDLPSGVTFSSDKVVLDSKPGQVPFITTISTTSSFNSSMTVTVNKQSEGSMPIQISIWDPISSDTLSIVFSYPNVVYCGTRKSIDTWETITEIGQYSVNSSCRVSILFIANTSITISFSNSTWSNVTAIKNGSILQRPVVNLSFFSTSTYNESTSTIDNYRVIIPTQSYYSYFVGSLKAWIYLIYVGISVLIVFGFRTEFLSLLKKGVDLLKRFILFIVKSKDGHKLLIILLFLFFIQVFLSTLGSHPYDIYTQKVWTYSIHQYGLASLYPESLIVPSGSARFGLSLINSYFPYPPFQSYSYLLVGSVYSFFSPTFDFNSPYLSFLLKLPSIFVTLLVACLIYFFIKRKLNSKYAFLLTLVFASIPALFFDTAIWGQPDIMLALLIICAILTLEYSVSASLFFLIASLLSKQFAIFPVALIFLLILIKYPLKKTLRGLILAICCVFLLLVPFLFSGYSLFFITNVSIGDKVFNIASAQPLGVPLWQQTVSGGAHNIWPILTLISNNQTGYSRFTFTDSAPNQIFGLPYVSFSVYLLFAFFVFILFLGLISIRRKEKNEAAKIAFISYLVIFSVYLLSTRMHERYLFMTIPFLILAFPWIKNRKIFAIICASLSATFFISIYSIFTLAAVWVPQALPNFLPSANPLNSIAYLFVTNDLAISALCIANVLIFAFSITFACFQFLNEYHQRNFKKRNFLIESFVEKSSDD